MKMNVVWWDRLIRFFLGVFMVAWAVAGGPWWAYGGLYALATGAWGYCAIYSLIGYRPLE